MRRQRQRATYPVICKRLTESQQPVDVSLFACRATLPAHTLGPPKRPFGPKISAVSDSQPLGVISRWLLLFGRYPPGLASVGEGDTAKKLWLVAGLAFLMPQTGTAKRSELDVHADM